MNYPAFRWLRHTLLITIVLSASLLSAGCYDDAQTADPVVEDFPVAYVKRPIPLNDQNEPQQTDVRDLDDFFAGGDLYLKERAAPGAKERNITFEFTGGLGDVKDLETSYDGTKIIFAMRAPEDEDADDDEQPTWNIWEYDITLSELRRLISSDITAEAGQDVAPHYLPDGRIVFSSTRQRQSGAILLDEGKPKYTAENEDRNGPAFVLHIMDEDGNNIRQVSFNQSHDLDPTVISSGEVVFSRWDNLANRNAINLYKMRPDGTELQILYGAHSHDTGTDGSTIQFLQPREMPDGQFVTTIKPFEGNDGGGQIVAIDIENYIDYNFPANSVLPTPELLAQEPLVDADIFTNEEISPDGRYRSVYPLWDGTRRLLVSWTPCRLIEEEQIVPCTAERLSQEAPQPAPPLYGMYLFNIEDNTHIPLTVPQEGTIIEEVITVQERTAPPILYDKQPGVELDSSATNEGVGILHIRSVYDMDGTDIATPNIRTVADPGLTSADERPARFLRIVKGVPMPDRDVARLRGTAFGRTAQQLMREIIGYAPIEPDGSVMVKVPANVPLMISILDKNGRRISQRHHNWLQVKPGETKECNGCHNHNTGIPHGRNDGPPSVYTGAGTSAIPFPNTEPTVIANMGETMAQTRMRISCETNCAALLPSVDIVFEDLWTDANVRPKDADFAYRYADLQTPAPTTANCQTAWTSLCRTIINYEQHIHPLWSVDRQVLDGDMNVIADNTCNTCHNIVDSMGNPQLPDAQLDLSDGPDSQVAAHFKSYRELLFNDNELELDIVNNILIERLVQATDGQGNLLFETDEEGELILDANEQPIPIMVPVRAPGPSMSANAANSRYFLQKFDSGGSHEGWLSNAEKRLISEWLDIGAQYYNNPFDVPQ